MTQELYFLAKKSGQKRKEKVINLLLMYTLLTASGLCLKTHSFFMNFKSGKVINVTTKK